MSDLVDETLRLRAKPNPFLYAFEATKIYLVLFLPAFGFVLAGYLRGVPLYLSLQIMLILYFGFYFVLLVVMVFGACGAIFIITDKEVLLRVSFFGRAADRISIPIDLIEKIEVRSYNARYGSVYLTCYRPSNNGLPSSQYNTSSSHLPMARLLRLASLTVKPCGLPIWLSFPATNPPVLGFYGFKNFYTFAKLILELQSKIA